MKAVHKAGHQMVLIVLILVGIGITMVYSSSSVLATGKHDDSSFFLERQLKRALLSLVIMVGLAWVPIEKWGRVARGLLMLGVLLLVAVLLFAEVYPRRWLPIPVPGFGTFAFQPSEFIKVALILYLADVLARHRELTGDLWKGFVPRLAVIGGILFLIVLQPNLGTVMAIGLISGVMLWAGGARLRHLVTAGLAAVPVVLVSLLVFPHQRERVLNFFQGADSQDGGYQLEQSLIALGSGGPTGVGLGYSMQKQYFLPEPHTDFVFSVLGEELGLWGTLLVVTLFTVFAFLGCRIAREASTYHGFLVATGITAMISIYALLNIGVATGMLPTTGLPLPFISYGGSALMWNLGAIGILARVARESSPGKVPWYQQNRQPGRLGQRRQ